MASGRDRSKPAADYGWRCLCRADCFDRFWTDSDMVEFVRSGIARRCGPVGRDNRLCLWPRCRRGDNPDLDVPDQLEGNIG